MRVYDMKRKTGAVDAQTIALRALAWMLSDEHRADRLLATTGLNADTLRAGIGDPAILGAVLDHLANYEPDLMACAAAIDCKPEAIVAAHRELNV